jgi:hypothetical protein
VSFLGRLGQRRRARDIARKLAELDRLDREHGLGYLPEFQTPGRPPVNRRRRIVATLLVVALVGGGALTTAPLRHQLASWASGPERLDQVPDAPHGKGPYAFMAHQQHSDDPVGYDPCRPIHVKVNSRGAPEDYPELVQTAIDHTSAATGLQFEYDGLTEDRITERARTIVSWRKPPPVLVAWTSTDEIGDLSGDVAGLGGSSWVETRPGLRQYVTGTVALDVAEFATISLRPDARAEEQAIIDHEFGHLVGLDHVHDPGELMNADNVGRTSYGPGDLEGLAAVGSTPCH